MNLIDQLADGDPLKYDAVFLLPNSTVFVKRMMLAENKRYQRARAKDAAQPTETETKSKYL